MANSTTGINDDIISQSALNAFVAALTPLNVFSTSYSKDAAEKGDRVSVPRALTADAAGDFDSAAGYSMQDADSDAVEVVLDKHKFVSWSLTDTEVSKSSALNLELFGMQKGFQLAKAVLVDIWSIITAANYSTAAFTGAASTFDADDVVDIGKVCDDAAMPETPRGLVLSSAYWAALLKDNAIQSTDAFGSSDPVQKGKIASIGGFTPYKSILIPANAENLVGFAAHPAAMAVAVRYLAPQEGHKYSTAKPLTDPESGLTIGIRDWYDENAGARKRVLECVFGKVTGVAAGLKRMVSA